MIQVGLEAPWYTFGKKIKALFERDPLIDVGDVYEADEEIGSDYAINITVKSHEKFIALDRVLPSNVNFGNVDLVINLIDEKSEEDPAVELFKTVFEGNPIVKDIVSRKDAAGTEWSYVRFWPEVIQFYDDDLTDYNGNWSGLAEDIAKEVFTANWVINFCTSPVNENCGEEGNG